MRALIICPSRGRPAQFAQTVRSFEATSTKASLVAYIGHDQEESYRRELEGYDFTLWNTRISEDGITNPGRVRIVIGKDAPPVELDNRVARLYQRFFDCMGVIPDDCEFQKPGWEEVLAKAFARFPGRIGAVAAHHDNGDCVNFPFVSREWFQTIGWLFYPHNHHHCCDTIIEILGECANAIHYCTAEEFHIQHHHERTQNSEVLDADLHGLLNFLVGDRRDLVRRLREAIADADEKMMRELAEKCAAVR